MSGEELLFLLLGGMGFVLLLGLGLVMICTDLGCGMFFACRNGGIYSLRTDRRLAEDTPANRRRFSRGIGLFFAAVDCLAFGVLVAVRIF